jgi:hypothetical protein
MNNGIEREIKGIEQKIQQIEIDIREAWKTRHNRREIESLENLIEINAIYSDTETDDFLWVE